MKYFAKDFIMIIDLYFKWLYRGTHLNQ